jgi:hypothetical protein
MGTRASTTRLTCGVFTTHASSMSLRQLFAISARLRGFANNRALSESNAELTGLSPRASLRSSHPPSTRARAITCSGLRKDPAPAKAPFRSNSPSPPSFCPPLRLTYLTVPSPLIPTTRPTPPPRARSRRYLVYDTSRPIRPGPRSGRLSALLFRH